MHLLLQACTRKNVLLPIEASVSYSKNTVSFLEWKSYFRLLYSISKCKNAGTNTRLQIYRFIMEGLGIQGPYLAVYLIVESGKHIAYLLESHFPLA